MIADIGVKLFASLKGNAAASGRALHPAKRPGMDFVMQGDALGVFNKHCLGLS
jgi:hypothetical protein